MDPQWFVTETKKAADSAPPIALGPLANARDASIRIATAPPDAADCAGFPDADRIWHAGIPSQALRAGSC